MAKVRPVPGLRAVPQPFPYQGSKRKLAPAIIQCIPPGTKRLVEPFAGSAAVSIGALAASRVGSVILNDKDAALVALWRRIVDDPRGLADDYTTIWRSQKGREREYYDMVREKFNRERRPEYLLFLLARCVKAAVRYNRYGEFNNSPDNRRKGMRPAVMAKNIISVSGILRNRVELHCGDYAQVLAPARENDLVYMDPPYQGVSTDHDKRYIEGVRFEEFVAALEKLDSRRVPFVVSYDGRTGDFTHGRDLPASLRLHRLEIDAGRSAQATLLGRDSRTIESLYLSQEVVERMGTIPDLSPKPVLAKRTFFSFHS